ncbi:THO complex protein [Malassezia pachydermatis]
MFERHIERLRASASVTSDYDIQTYNEEAKALMKQCEQEKEKISELKQVLNEAQQDRQHKVEYNEIARKILVYPSRDDMEMTLQELKDKITTLQTDIAKYDEASSQARNGLQDVSGIVQRLHGDVRASLGMKPLLVENVAESQAASTSLDPAAPSFTPTSQPAGKRDHSDSKESDASTQTLSPSKEAQPAKRTKTSKGSSST